MIKKTKKIAIERREEFEIKSRMPQISERSRILAHDRTLEDLINHKCKKPVAAEKEPVKVMKASQLEAFVSRNYENMLKVKLMKEAQLKKRNAEKPTIKHNYVCKGSKFLIE